MTFVDFWNAWPKNTQTYTRKGCRAECYRRWTQRDLDDEAEQIVRHVLWLKTTADWQKDGGAYIPAPLVYLNQSRWDGADIPEPEKKENINAQFERDRKAAFTQESIAARERCKQALKVVR